MSKCLFCRILDGELPSTRLYEDDDVVAILDIKPEAPTHFLVIPRKHIDSALDAAPEDSDLMGKMVKVAADLVKQKGHGESGCRMVFNSKADGNQSVNHIHLHVLAGRFLAWPPG